MKYQIAHLCIALTAMTAVIFSMAHVPDPNWFAGCLVGCTIYISREIRDREKLGYWDWKGLLWPCLGCIFLYLIKINI